MTNKALRNDESARLPQKDEIFLAEAETTNSSAETTDQQLTLAFVNKLNTLLRVKGIQDPHTYADSSQVAKFICEFSKHDASKLATKASQIPATEIDSLVKIFADSGYLLNYTYLSSGGPAVIPFSGTTPTFRISEVIAPAFCVSNSADFFRVREIEDKDANWQGRHSLNVSVINRSVISGDFLDFATIRPNTKPWNNVTEGDFILLNAANEAAHEVLQSYYHVSPTDERMWSIPVKQSDGRKNEKIDSLSLHEHLSNAASMEQSPAAIWYEGLGILNGIQKNAEGKFSVATNVPGYEYSANFALETFTYILSKTTKARNWNNLLEEAWKLRLHTQEVLDRETNKQLPNLVAAQGELTRFNKKIMKLQKTFLNLLTESETQAIRDAYAESRKAFLKQLNSQCPKQPNSP